MSKGWFEWEEDEFISAPVPEAHTIGNVPQPAAVILALAERLEVQKKIWSLFVARY